MREHMREHMTDAVSIDATGNDATILDAICISRDRRGLWHFSCSPQKSPEVL